MSDKVQKIKQGIERRIESMNSCHFKTAELGSEKFDDGELYAYKQILQFIDSLPEEPASENKSEKELSETYLATFDKKYPILPTLKGKQKADFKNFLNKCQQEFGLKEFGIHPTQSKLFEKLTLLWATWGAEHLECSGESNQDEFDKMSASEDLEEAATKWDETASFQPFYMQLDSNGNPCEVKQDITTHKESFKAGAEWQKQQMKEAIQTEYEKGRFDMREEMMKVLIGGEIVKDIHNQLSVKSEPLNNAFGDIKLGDKVKIIIVKEEQQ